MHAAAHPPQELGVQPLCSLHPPIASQVKDGHSSNDVLTVTSKLDRVQSHYRSTALRPTSVPDTAIPGRPDVHACAAAFAAESRRSCLTFIAGANAAVLGRSAAVGHDAAAARGAAAGAVRRREASANPEHAATDPKRTASDGFRRPPGRQSCGAAASGAVAAASGAAATVSGATAAASSGAASGGAGRRGLSGPCNGSRRSQS